MVLLYTHIQRLLVIVSMPELRDFFEVGAQKYHERTLFAPDGTQLRPDSFVILPNGKVSILDYKTGSPHIEHKKQLHTYAKYLNEMGHEIEGLFLLYVGNMLKLEQIS